MRHPHKKTDSGLCFLPRRAVYQEKGYEAGKAPEGPKAGPPAAPAKKTETYTLDELKQTREKTVKKIEEKIKHPEVRDEAKKELTGKLAPLEDQLGKLEQEKNEERVKLKQQVDSAVNQVLEAKRDFKKFSVSLAGRTYEFDVNPPMPIEKYEAMEKKATSSVNVLRNYKPEGTLEGKIQNINGDFIFKILLDRKKNPKLPEGAFKDVTISGAQVMERYSDPKLEDLLGQAVTFQEAFEQWKTSPQATFTYGDPPKTFPPAGFNMEVFLKDREMKRSDLKPEYLLQLNEKTFQDLAVLNVTQKFRTLDYEKRGNAFVASTVKIEETKLLSPDTNSTEIGPDVLRFRKVEYRIVNQQRRRVEVVTDYWPPGPGEKKELKIRKIEEYEDGVVTSRTQFDRQGKLVERTSRVNGCDGVEAVDKPAGPPYKEAQVLDERGKPVMDKDGKPLMERITKREMIIRDTDGKETGRIRVYQAENEHRKKLGQKPLTEQEYMASLGQKLQSKEQVHAFINLMFRYRYDEPDKDKWQEAEHTLKRTENGVMIGDCEDYAFVLKRILEAQGKKVHVVAVPGHAECVAISRDSKGKYHAISYGTFGVDHNGNRVGEKHDAKRSEGYDTPEQALRTLQGKWAYKNSGNPEMGDGNLFDEFKEHKTYKGHLSVMSVEPESVKTKFATMFALRGLEFDASGNAMDAQGNSYTKTPEGIKDKYGNVFKQDLGGAITDAAGNKYVSLSDGRLEDSNGNRYQMKADGVIARETPLKLDDGVLSPHEEVKEAAKPAPKAPPKAVAAPKAAPKAAPAAAAESPEVKDARAKMLNAGRGVLAVYVGKNLDELKAAPDLGAEIRNAIEARVKAAGLPSFDMAVLLPGKISVSVKKGNVAVGGAEGYAAMLIRRKTEMAAEKPPAVPEEKKQTL